MLHQNKKPIFLAAGTYAAIEVKSVLTTSNLVEALHASTRIKKMRKFLNFKESGVIRFNQTGASICTGLFAYSSRIKPRRIQEILLEYYESGISKTDMIDFICIIGECCFHRFRFEDAAAYAESGTRAKQMTLNSARRQCRYGCSPESFGMMLSKLLQYVSYLGPIQLELDMYLHPRG